MPANAPSRITSRTTTTRLGISPMSTSSTPAPTMDRPNSRRRLKPRRIRSPRNMPAASPPKTAAKTIPQPALPPSSVFLMYDGPRPTTTPPAEKYGEADPSDRLTSASSPKNRPAIGAGPKVPSRLYWLACSSLSGGTRFGTDASLAGVQNSEAHDARNCTAYIQVSLFAKPNDRL